MIAVALIVIEVETSIEWDAVEQARHVLDRVDGDADSANLSGCHGMVGVVSHLRRKVEGDAQAGDAMRRKCRYRALDSSAEPKPAYWRIVHRRPRYIVGWMPRVKEIRPGSRGPKRLPNRQGRRVSVLVVMSEEWSCRRQTWAIVARSWKGSCP